MPNTNTQMEPESSNSITPKVGSSYRSTSGDTQIKVDRIDGSTVHWTLTTGTPLKGQNSGSLPISEFGRQFKAA
jgi:hypothetical protein